MKLFASTALLLVFGQVYCKYCDKQSDCEEEECCLKRWPMSSAKCERRRAESQSCVRLIPTSIFGDTFLFHCPCKKGLRCKFHQSKGKLGTLFFSPKCLPPIKPFFEEPKETPGDEPGPDIPVIGEGIPPIDGGVVESELDERANAGETAGNTKKDPEKKDSEVEIVEEKVDAAKDAESELEKEDEEKEEDSESDSEKEDEDSKDAEPELKEKEDEDSKDAEPELKEDEDSKDAEPELKEKEDEDSKEKKPDVGEKEGEETNDIEPHSEEKGKEGRERESDEKGDGVSKDSQSGEKVDVEVATEFVMGMPKFGDESSEREVNEDEDEVTLPNLEGE